MREIAPKVLFCDDDISVKECLQAVQGKINGSDTETTGLDPTRKNERLRLVQLYDPESEYGTIFDIWKLNEESHARIAAHLMSEERVKIFHNAKFDMKFLYVDLYCDLQTRVFCTMIAHQLVVCGDEDERHSLKWVVEKYFPYVNLDKSFQRADWSLSGLPDDQLMYSFTDTKYLPELRNIFINELRDQGQLQAAKIEFEAIAAVVEVELTGMTLDVKRWVSNVNRQRVRMTRLEAKISQLLNPTAMLFDSMPTFKVSSPIQVRQKMKEAGIKIPVQKDKKTGELKETIGADFLELIKDSHPVIPLYIKYSTIKQYHNAFGDNYLKWINPDTGCIHPNIKQIGPITGRMAFYDPNLQQIPAISVYRGCFIAGEGYKLVISDYSQIELRILADQSGDEAMMKAFIEGHDLHRYTGSLVFHIPMEKVTIVQRRMAKDLNFGIVFGIGAEKFARSSGLPLHEAKMLMGNFFAAYARLNEHLRECENQGKYKKESRTASGRLVKYKIPEGDWRALSKAGRNGKNTPVQGTSADITKYAIGLMKQRLINPEYNSDAQIKFAIVNKLRSLGYLCHIVHDEIVTRCKSEDANKVMEIQESCMIEAGETFIDKVPVKVETKISDRWIKD